MNNLGFPIGYSTDTMKKTRGGQYKSVVEKARVWAWYFEVKSRCDWSDYALDNQFAWTAYGQATKSADADRPRTFEWIRKSARQPQGYDNRWHDMDGLVRAVEDHCLFRGSKKIYTAGFWDIAKRQTIPSKTIESRIGSLLEINDIIQVDVETHSALYKCIQYYGYTTVFDRCFRLTLRKLDELVGLELIWLMYVMSESANNWPIRAVIEKIADQHLNSFFDKHFPSQQHLIFYTDFIDKLISARMDLSDNQGVGNGHIEVLVNRPLVHQSMIKHLSAKELFCLN